MTGYSRGDVVLVNFFFSDESGVKRRPALIISAARYQQKRQEAIVAAITSTVNRLLVGDHKMKDWNHAGLLHPSVVTGIIRTVKQDMIHRKLGAVSAGDQEAVEQKLRAVLAL
jgi:mRNA interferase MazF